MKLEDVVPPKPPTAVLPIEIPRILFEPDSSGTIFLGALSSEKAFLALYSSSAEGFSTFFTANLPTKSASKSVAPSGGFYSSFLAFFPFPLPFSSTTSTTGTGSAGF